MQGVEKQPHIQLTKSDVCPVVLVVGDPGRAALLASFCEQNKELAYNREYRSFNCTHKGQSFTVVSHGVGSAGCAICFEELIALGAKVIIRVGTCGSLQPKKYKQGDVIVCHAAAREDGPSSLMAPAGLPAIADPYIYSTLARCAKEHGTGTKFGITVSSDLFYTKHCVLPSTLDTWVKCNCDVVEMEASTLFILATLAGIKSGFIGTVDGSPLSWEAGDYDPSGTKVADGKKSMMQIAINAAVRLSEEKLY